MDLDKVLRSANGTSSLKMQRIMSHGVTTLHKIGTYHSFFVDHSDTVGLGCSRRMHSQMPSHTAGVRGYHVCILVWERISGQSSHTTGVRRYHVSTHSPRILVWQRTAGQSSHTTGLREYHVHIPFQHISAMMVWNMVCLGVVRFW